MYHFNRTRFHRCSGLSMQNAGIELNLLVLTILFLVLGLLHAERVHPQDTFDWLLYDLCYDSVTFL
ncbi:hypothetical protein BDZ89DRAFT_497512 [Hymenopellis radicata]|nr:hypothetical protein BDZ89DRAFT_497512 [Hymenopellis radicata]